MSKNRTSIIKPLIISLLASLAMMAIWFILSTRMDSTLSWFALIAGLDIALLERLLRRPDQKTARWIAPITTIFCIITSLWLISALSVHYAAGFNLLDSASQMGHGLFMQLVLLRLTTSDWLVLASAPVLAYFLANVVFNGRHQSL